MRYLHLSRLLAKQAKDAAKAGKKGSSGDRASMARGAHVSGATGPFRKSGSCCTTKRNVRHGPRKGTDQEPRSQPIRRVDIPLSVRPFM